MDAEEKKKNVIFYVIFNSICGGCIFICLPLFIFLVIGLPWSLKTVEYNKWGIHYNNYKKTVEKERTYDPGMYWIGMNHRFITFPRTFVAASFTGGSKLGSRTKDGLAISLDISFQYKIEKKNVQWVFDRFAEKYDETVKYISRDILRDVCSRFNAFQFFTNRAEIGNVMEDEIRDVLSTIRITVGYFQLRSIDLPDDYESIIEESEIQRQRTLKAGLDQEAAIVNAETETMISKERMQINIISAEADRQVYEVQAQATANRTSALVGAYSEVYGELQEEIGLDNEELISYIFTEAISAHSGPLVVSLQIPDNIDL